MEVLLDSQVFYRAMHVTDDWLQSRAGVHRSTVARWRATRRYPPAVARLAEIEAHGRLELIHAHWDGWRIDSHRGELVSPQGARYTPGAIMALGLRSQQVVALQQALNARGILRRLWNYLRSWRWS